MSTPKDRPETEYERQVRESAEDREIDAYEFAQQDAEEDYDDPR